MRRLVSILLVMVMMVGVLPITSFATNEAFVSFRINDDTLKDHIPMERFHEYKVYVNGNYFNSFDNMFRFDYGMAKVGEVLNVVVAMDGYQRYEVNYQVKPDPGTGLENDYIIYLKRLEHPPAHQVASDYTTTESTATSQPAIITKTIDETTQKILVNEMGLQIDLPNYVVDEATQLTVKEVNNSHNNGMPDNVVDKEVIDISLGNIHELTGFATIVMNYDQSKVPAGVEEAAYVSAMYLNEQTNLWEDIYYEVDTLNNKLYIKTDHFSIFALLFSQKESAREVVKPESLSMPIQTDSDLITALKKVDASIKDISDYKLVEAAEFITGTNSLQNLNKGLSYYGKGKKVFAIHEAIWATGNQTPEAKKAVLDGAKAIVDYGMDELVSLPAAASVGVTIIDYALTEFIDAAFEGNEKVYYNAYTDFYNTAKGPGVKSIKEWIAVIEPMIDPQNPQDLSRKLDLYVADYLNEIWDGGDNEGWFDDQVHAAGKNFGYQSLLTPAMKVKLADKFKPTLYNTRIVPALTQIRDAQMEAAEQALYDMYWDLEMKLVLPNGLVVDFKEPAGQEGTYALNQVKISLLDANNNVFRNTPQNIKYRTNAKEIPFTLLELLEQKVDLKAVKIEMPLHDGSYKTETITLPFNPFEKKFGEVTVMLPDNYIEFENTKEVAETKDEKAETGAKDMKTTTFVFKDADTKEQIISNVSLIINATSFTAYKGKRHLSFDANESKKYNLKISTDDYETKTLSLDTAQLKNYVGKTYEIYLKPVEAVVEDTTNQTDTGLYHNIIVYVTYRYDAFTEIHPETVNITFNGTLYPNVELDERGAAIFRIPRTPGPWHEDPVNVEITVPGAKVPTKICKKTTNHMQRTTYKSDDGEVSAYYLTMTFDMPKSQ